MDQLLPLLIIAFYIYLVITVVMLLLDNREPSSTLAWVFVFLLIPFFGVLIYIFVGRNWRRVNRKTMLTQQFLEKQSAQILSPLLNRQPQEIEKLERRESLCKKRKLFRLFAESSNSILTTTNSIQILKDGEQKFSVLKQDLKDAQHSIHMEYFIWRVDSLTQEIKNILIERRKAGVKVRILYDAMGSIFLKKKYIEELRESGVEIYPYFNFRSFFKIHTINYRNHRKIVVVDGKVGYSGGMNMGQEYIDGGKHFDRWRDTHLRIEGESVSVLQSIFVTSWYNTTKEKLFDLQYFPRVMYSDKVMPVQVTTSGPDSEWPSIKHLYFTLISLAEEKVYIQSPYFVPDPSVLMALKMAALSGLDVRIIIAGVPDKKLPYWSAYTYFKDLLKAGVRIYHYQKGFMHAKTIMIDSEICSVGTANMDVRSFHLNYELNTLIYDAKTTQILEEDFAADLKNSQEMTLRKYGKLSEVTKLRNSLARLLAPLL